MISFRAVVSGAVALAFAAVVPAPSYAADANTIVFGAALAATGRDAREGVLTKEGYEFWKDYVNAHGGIKTGGKTYKVDIQYADDETNAQTSAKLVEKFINQDHVNFILGPYGSATTFASGWAVTISDIAGTPLSRENARCSWMPSVTVATSRM
ncbi:MAG: hypothetical protein NVS3B17_16780 [Vulcanimicrobiaceae bacterium]